MSIIAESVSDDELANTGMDALVASAVVGKRYAVPLTALPFGSVPANVTAPLLHALSLLNLSRIVGEPKQRVFTFVVAPRTNAAT